MIKTVWYNKHMQVAQNTNEKNDTGQLKPPKKVRSELFVYKVVLGIEMVAMVGLLIANLVVGFYKPNGGAGGAGLPNNTSSNAGFCKHRTKEELLTFVEEVSKEEAIEIAKKLNGKDSCIPEGLVPESLKLRSDEYAYELLYSYDDVSEVPAIAADSVMGLDTRSPDSFKIDEATDKYAIVSVDLSKTTDEKTSGSSSSNSHYRGISYNREYLDYHEVVEGNLHTSELVVKDRTEDFAKLVLGVNLISDIMNSHSLFDYYFEDKGDSYVMTGVHFGVGVDMTEAENISAYSIPYAVNIFEKRMVLDKATGEMAWEKHESAFGGESKVFNLRSIPLTDEDVLQITAAINNLGDEEVNELREQNRDEDELTGAEMLERRVTAICGKDYTTVYKSSDNTGIFKCNNYTKAIYSITNPERTEKDYKHTALATYLGTDDDEVANKYFGDKLYVYQDYRNTSIRNQLILLVEGSSEEAVVEQNLDAIYSYIKELNEKYKADINIKVFYTDSLNQTSDLKDYIVLSAAAGFYDGWLPHGNGFGNYYYASDKKTPALVELTENPNLYSNQTRDAIKFHRHIEAEINNGREITKEALRQLLRDSFEAGL